MPLRYCWHDNALDDYAPTKPWHDLPPTQAQVECLARRGWRVPRSWELTRGEAARLIDSPTPAMKAALRSHGVDPAGMNFIEAWAAISDGVGSEAP